MLKYKCHQKVAQNKRRWHMNTIGGQIRSQNLLKIKQIVDKDNLSLLELRKT